MTLETLQLRKEILIGKTTEGEGIVLKIDTDPNHRDEEDKYFSISGETYDMDNVFTESEGEQRAREYLEDGDLWKDAVEHDRTTLSMDEWIDQVLSVDGWEHVLGDIYDIGNGKYVSLNSCGQIDVSHTLDDWDKLIIEQAELDIILDAWKKLHLKEFGKMSKEELELTQKVVDVFKKYEEFDHPQLSLLLDEEES